MTLGVLLMSYGTPSVPEDLEGYYTHIRRGRPPTPEQLDDLRRRYDAIGGLSPLAARTKAQVRGVQAALDACAPGRYQVFTGAKHAAPFLEDAVQSASAAGVSGLVAMVLAPHYSALSVGEYLERVETAAADRGLPVYPVRGWPAEPDLIRMLAARVLEALDQLGGSGSTPGGGVRLLVSAHSLPKRVIDMGDPYPQQLADTAAALADALPEGRVTDWNIAWQSAGRTPEPWLGPDVLEEIDRAAADGRQAVLVCPAGFTSDHLEVLYDLDIEARARAAERQIGFARTASLNDDADFCRLVADLVRRAAPDA